MTLRSLQSFGEAQVEVCYDYDPGEPEGRRGSATDGPATPASVFVTGVMIQGVEVDRSLFAPQLVEKWEHQILEARRFE